MGACMWMSADDNYSSLKFSLPFVWLTSLIALPFGAWKHLISLVLSVQKVQFLKHLVYKGSNGWRQQDIKQGAVLLFHLHYIIKSMCRAWPHKSRIAHFSSSYIVFLFGRAWLPWIANCLLFIILSHICEKESVLWFPKYFWCFNGCFFFFLLPVE